MKKVYKGKISFGDKDYECMVINGVRYIDGKTIDEFLKTLELADQQFLAKIGQIMLTRKRKIKN